MTKGSNEQGHDMKCADIFCTHRGRRYVRARSDTQLRGGNPAPSAMSACEPQLFQGGNSSLTIEPCGLVAWSLFNDTFQARPGLPTSALKLPLC